MARTFISLAMIATLLLGGLLSAPDAHADEPFAGTHVADHIAAHGLEHFDEPDHSERDEGNPHPEGHHHNCSFDVPQFARTTNATLFAIALPVHPLAEDTMHSRALDVLKEPPIA